jgi:hypothetical protein
MNVIMLFQGKWMELEMIMLSKVSHAQKDKCHIFMHMWNSEIITIIVMIPNMIVRGGLFWGRKTHGREKGKGQDDGG